MIDFYKEQNFIKHSLCMSIFSPIASLYQIIKIFNVQKNMGLVGKNKSIFFKNLKHVRYIYPQQFILRYAQIHVSTKVKENLSVIPAFGLIGILQGGIYGHTNLYFSNKFGITKNIKITDYFRGPIYAASRDILSQGMPFLLTPKIEKMIFNDNSTKYHYPTLFGISLISTFLSHPFHCLQIYCQNNRNKNQYQIAKEIIKKHKLSLFYIGIESRIILILFTNLFNDFFLREIWEL